MRTLLLAAGMGTRLKPITNSVPKCLVEVCNKPLLEYWLLLLNSKLIDEVFINLNYLSEQVELFLRQRNNGKEVIQLYEPILLGTAGTIKKNYKSFCGEPLMVIHADNLSQFNLGDFINKYESRAPNVEITMMTFYTDKPKNCGIVELDAGEVVVNFFEKIDNPPSNLANAAVYIISPKVIDFIYKSEKTVFDFSSDVIPHFMGRINIFHNSIYHRDIGTPESLELAKTEFTNFIGVDS